ncbi:roadblock/LC7 domain-containing protein [Streptomyces sp. NPDC092952]|uniref:roadblock/LC7 domain-containing protein n=1 Tax=Streptomyces sp. NPDC092952 TaxID=3366018 RepID=UPI003824A3A9
MIRALRLRAGAKQPPTPESGPENVLAELRRLRAGLPLVSGSLVAGTDGLVLAHDAPEIEPETVAALTASALGVAVRMTEAADRGGFGEFLVRGESGCLAAYTAGESAVLTLFAEDRIDIDRLRAEGRRAAARIGALIDAPERRAAPPAPSGCPAPAAPSAPSPRQLPPQPPRPYPSRP